MALKLLTECPYQPPLGGEMTELNFEVTIDDKPPPKCKCGAESYMAIMGTNGSQFLCYKCWRGPETDNIPNTIELCSDYPVRLN